MDRKKAIFAYEIAIITPLVVITIISNVTGQVFIATVPGLLGSIALMAACLIATHTMMKNKVSDVTTKALNKYDYECDPKAFVLVGSQTAYNALQEREKDTPLAEGDAWFMAPLGLALIDTGDVANAEKIATAIMEDAMKQEKFASQAAMLVHLEPLVLRLRGSQDAMSILTKAQELFEYDGKGKGDQFKPYIDHEMTVLKALAEGDQDTLISTFTRVMRSEHQPTRVRVLDADALASIYRSKGDESSEIECLHFVETYGNKLPVVAAAERRLEELMSAPDAAVQDDDGDFDDDMVEEFEEDSEKALEASSQEPDDDVKTSGLE